MGKLSWVMRCLAGLTLIPDNQIPQDISATSLDVLCSACVTLCAMPENQGNDSYEGKRGKSSDCSQSGEKVPVCRAGKFSI